MPLIFTNRVCHVAIMNYFAIKIILKCFFSKGYENFSAFEKTTVFRKVKRKGGRDRRKERKK